MRKYIRNEELYSTLQEILSRQNPELLEVYKDVILYRIARKRNTQAEIMLQYPVKLSLCLVNLLLLPIVGTVFTFSMFSRLPEIIALVIAFSLLFFTIYEGFRFSRLAAKFHLCHPYLVIDELFARHILIVQSTSTSKPAKAAD